MLCAHGLTGAVPSSEELKDLRRAWSPSGYEHEGVTQSGQEHSDVRIYSTLA